jgi:Resolvase, N terminal domain
LSRADRTLPITSGTLSGYARCSTDKRDPTAQRARLRELGVTEKRIYLDYGLTGTNRKRPGLDQALAAVRDGDTLVVPKLDRLARSVPDARDIGDSLAELFTIGRATVCRSLQRDCPTNGVSGPTRRAMLGGEGAVR